jgi:betaine-aldehyde dehydrogenase
MKTKLYINGSWVSPASGETIDVVNPATEKIIHQAPAGGTLDIDTAVKAAREAFDQSDWPHLSGKQRAVYLRAFAKIITRRQQALAELEVLDNGKPLPEALWDIEDAAGCFEYYAGLAEAFDSNKEQAITLIEPGFTCTEVKEPLGVVGAIIPWNYPLLMAAWKIAPAMAAGCTVILKPSELTPLSALELGSIADEVGLPKGVLNIVTGFGAQAGQALTEHAGIDKLAFTGSVPTGTMVMKAAANDIKNISLELGGKSPFIVFADSDISKAVEWIMFGIFWNQGEVCSATSRVLVERKLYDALLQRLVEEAQKIKMGDGFAKGVLLGPLVSRGQHEKVLAAIERGRADGATVLTGGKQPASLTTGYFIEPTIMTDMSENDWIWREEIFGPVVCVKPFDTEKQALTMANDSRFGLAAAVMSQDDKRCERVSRALRAGIVWINCSQPTFTEAPWGGYKQSGIGRELGRWGFENYLETKQITRYTRDEPWGWYIGR